MKIADIKTTFFVRKSLSQERIQFFYDILKAGGTLNRGIVDKDTSEMIDGRHRMAAHEKFGSSDMDVEFRRYETQEARISAALAANSGGALPPSNEDVYHVIEYLFGLKFSRKKITEMVAQSLGTDPRFVQNAISYVLSRLRKIANTQAADAVAKGQGSISEMAEKFGVKEDDIRAILQGNLARANRNDIGLKLTNMLKGASRSIGAQLNLVQNAVGSGEMTAAEAKEIVDQIEGQLKNMIRRNVDWLARFGQSAATPKAAVRLGKQRAKTKRYLAKKTPGDTGNAALEAMGL